MPRLPKQCNMDLDQSEHEINLFFEEFPKKTLFHRWRDVSWKGLNLLVMELVPLCPALRSQSFGNAASLAAKMMMVLMRICIYILWWYMIHDTWYIWGYKYTLWWSECMCACVLRKMITSTNSIKTRFDMCPI